MTQEIDYDADAAKLIAARIEMLGREVGDDDLFAMALINVRLNAVATRVAALGDPSVVNDIGLLTNDIMSFLNDKLGSVQNGDERTKKYLEARKAIIDIVNNGG